MTRALREQLPLGVIAPEQGVVLDRDPSTARAKARDHLAMYLRLPNYTNNWLRHGFAQADLADGGSDRLVDDLVVWGDIDAVVAGVDAHWRAGADHVCVQVIGSDDPSAAPDLRRLAPALTEAASDIAHR